MTQEKDKVPNTREESRTLVPPVDIFEHKDSLIVVADLPGVAKGDADLNVDNSVLTIKGKATAHPKGDAVVEEYALYDYFRQFELSEEIDQEKISAELKNGVLTIQLPKKEKAKPKRITVSAD